MLEKIFEDSDKFIEKVEKNLVHLNFLYLKYIIYICWWYPFSKLMGFFTTLSLETKNMFPPLTWKEKKKGPELHNPSI